MLIQTYGILIRISLSFFANLNTYPVVYYSTRKYSNRTCLHHSTMHLPTCEPFPCRALKQYEIHLLHIISGDEDLISIELDTMKTPKNQRLWALSQVWCLRRSSLRFSSIGSHSVSREIVTMLSMDIGTTNSILMSIR